MISHRAPSLNALWADLIVEELVRNQVSHFVLSPGFRCAPLAVAVASNEKATSTVHFDERGAAYYALGYGRATGRPSALVCTSGTAAANYYPAVIEAATDMVSMILLTADRPPELRQTGANQTIDQVNLYGKYVRFHVDLPCPDECVPLGFVLTTIDQAVYRSARSPAGPVHLNCMFREPLAPPEETENFSGYLAGIEEWIGAADTYTSYERPINSASAAGLEQVASIISKSERGLLVIGSLRNATQRESVRRLIDSLNWPVFADIRSGLRLGAREGNIVAYFDQLLLSKRFERIDELTILHIGGVPISKRWLLFLDKSDLLNYVHVADHPFRRDPQHKVTLRIESDICDFCERIMPLIRNGDSGAAANAAVELLREADRTVGNIIEKHVESEQTLTEVATARIIPRNVPEGTCLYLANSMPIRDMDMYADPSGPRVDLAANRGASGIDGNIASAAGYVQGLNTGGTLLIGDLAFLHDVNSLALLKRLAQPLVIVVVNNNGGGLFSFLPIRNCTHVFEPFFGTPHNLTFEKCAAMFNLKYYRPQSKEELVGAYRTAFETGRSAIIEVVTGRDENLETHLVLQDKIKSAIDNL